MDFVGVGSGVDAMAGMETGARAGRRDGRSSAEMRALSVTQGVLHAADGSARIKIGATDVLVAVYGPIECPIAKQHAERAEVHIEYRRRTTTLLHGSTAAEGMEAVATRDLKEIVQECLLAALNPRRAVSVTVHILSDDGGVTAAAINAATLALIDAGLPMQSAPIAACVSVHNDTLVVDPNRAEELEAQAVLTFTFNGTGTIDDGYIAVATQGDCGGEKLFAAASGTAHDLAVKTLAFFKLSIESKQNQSRVW